MTSRTLKFFAGALFLGAVGVVWENAAAATDATLAEIAQYRQWTRVTQKPLVVYSVSSAFE